MKRISVLVCMNSLCRGYSTAVRARISQSAHQLTRNAKKESKSHKKSLDGSNAVLVISCKRQQHNFYNDSKGTGCYKTINLKDLASGGWMHYKSKGDYFTINPFAKTKFLDKDVKFQDLGLSKEVLSALDKLDITSPSYIQTSTIPEIMNLSNVICTAETGSGKTLAYLLPVVDRLLQCRKALKQPNDMNIRPRAVVLVPTIELAKQLEVMASQLCEPLEINSVNIALGHETNTVIKRLKSYPTDIDLLIATPGSLSVALRTNTILPDLVNHIVIDEADTIMDDSFNKLTTNLLRRLTTKEIGVFGVQFVLTSATMPKGLDYILNNIIDVSGFSICSTSRLHYLMGHVSQKFIRLCHTEKPDWLANHLNEHPDVATIIFVNKSAAAMYLNDMLAKRQIPSIVLHGSISSKERLQRYQQFKEGQCKTVICSDLYSRGLDTSKVGQVINFDMPRFVSDYIHRVGRVGRLGSLTSGKIINLVAHRPQVNLVWNIETAIRTGQELQGVNANIKRHIRASLARKYQDKQ